MSSQVDLCCLLAFKILVDRLKVHAPLRYDADWQLSQPVYQLYDNRPSDLSTAELRLGYSDHSGCLSHLPRFVVTLQEESLSK